MEITKTNGNVPGKLNDQDFEQLILKGDLSGLNPAAKIHYYNEYCKRLNLDPLTLPFKILKTDGKETLYCDRSGTQQLSKINSVSHEIISRDTQNGCVIVVAKAFTPDGRKSESIGAVSIEKENGEWKDGQNGRRFFQGNGTFTMLRGEALCNAMMKAETKAKRRATLDLLGIGITDESEIESIPYATTIVPGVNTKDPEKVTATVVQSPTQQTATPQATGTKAALVSAETLAEYRKVVASGTHLLSEEERKAMLDGCEKWTEMKVKNAIAKAKKTIADKEAEILK